MLNIAGVNIFQGLVNFIVKALIYSENGFRLCDNKSNPLVTNQSSVSHILMDLEQLLLN